MATYLNHCRLVSCSVWCAKLLYKYYIIYILYKPMITYSQQNALDLPARQKTTKLYRFNISRVNFIHTVYYLYEHICMYMNVYEYIWKLIQLISMLFWKFQLWFKLFQECKSYKMKYCVWQRSCSQYFSTCIYALEMLFISLIHLIYRIRYRWQWHVRYFHLFQQYMTRPLVIYVCISSSLHCV